MSCSSCVEARATPGSQGCGDLDFETVSHSLQRLSILLESFSHAQPAHSQIPSASPCFLHDDARAHHAATLVLRGVRPLGLGHLHQEVVELCSQLDSYETSLDQGFVALFGTLMVWRHYILAPRDFSGRGEWFRIPKGRCVCFPED